MSALFQPQRVLLFGASGLLGGTLAPLLTARGIALDVPTHADCDIAEEAAVRARIGSFAPDLVINCAAYNAVDEAESQADRAARNNALAPGILARASPVLVHFSTDFVFGAPAARPFREDDAPSPQSAYARSKAEGDAAVLAGNPRHFLFRVGCLYGRGTRGFGSNLLRRLRAGERIRCDAERRVQPTWVKPLAAQILLAVEQGGFGLFHAM
ncbi:MAG: SDR family oxidoreductase, partial [Myxococcales bacterium]